MNNDQTAGDRSTGPMTLTRGSIAPILPNTVTSVIEQDVRPEKIEQYELWLKKIVSIAASYPGHLGVNVIYPSNGTTRYTVAARFDTLENSQNWFLSGVRRDLIAEAAPFLNGDESIKTVTGLEFWFRPAAPAGPKAPKRYKQLLVTLFVLYPLTLIVPTLVKSITQHAPALQIHLLEHFIGLTLVVALMTYVVMPRLVKQLSKWLFA